ncbi:DUF4235 domain-containing protein [Streptomyces sp. bgisy159]|uniref:DUF4235 domain-containing protein n=1 Tax=Streptomyces sp. bgisy159 TaxID=3413795 RepID=UPI003F49D7C5
MAKKRKLSLVYQPIGLAFGWAGGALAAYAFRRTWQALRHEDDAPDPLDRERSWGEVLLAAAIQGAIFSVVRGAADRAGAKAIERSTGVWPAKEPKDAKGRGDTKSGRA